MYGEALSGIIELTANTIQDEKFNFGFGANLYDTYGFLELPISAKVKTFLSLRRSYNITPKNELYSDTHCFVMGFSDDIKSNIKGYNNFYPDLFYYYDLLNKWIFNLSSKDKITSTFYLSRDIDRTKVNVFDENSFSNTRTDFQKIQNSSGYACNYLHQWNAKWQSKICASFSNLNYKISDIYESSTSYSRNNLKLYDYSIHFDNTFNLESVEFKAGYNGKKIIYKIPSTDPDMNQDYNHNYHSLYFQSDLTPVKKLNLSLGLRSTNGKLYQPYISTRYQIKKELELTAKWGIYHQYLYEHFGTSLNNHIYYSFLPGSGWFSSWNLLGYKNKTCYTNNYIIILNYNLNGFYINTESYYKKYNNFFYYDPEQTTLDRALYDGKAISYGFEINVKKCLGKYSGWISYHYNNIDYTLPEFNNRHSFKSSYNRSHECKLVHQLQIGSWNLSAIGIFASGARYTRYTGPEESMNESTLPLYERVDLNITKHVRNLLNLNWEFSIGLLNIFNHKNIWDRTSFNKYWPTSIYDYSMLGFTPMVSLSCQLH